MILASFKEKENGSLRLTVKGHAGTAPAGEDMVCAGVTTLAYTAAQAVQTLHQDGKLGRRPKIALSEGRALVIATPSEGARQELVQTFRVIQSGMEMLSHNYPHCIRVENTV